MNLISKSLLTSFRKLSSPNDTGIILACVAFYPSAFYLRAYALAMFSEVSPVVKTSVRRSPPSSASLIERSLKLVDLSIGTYSDYARISPASKTPFAISITDVPVWESWLRIACWIGHAPRYFGKSDGCMTSMPLGKASMISSGIILPNEAITPTSNRSDLSCYLSRVHSLLSLNVLSKKNGISCALVNL